MIRRTSPGWRTVKTTMTTPASVSPIKAPAVFGGGRMREIERHQGEWIVEGASSNVRPCFAALAAAFFGSHVNLIFGIDR